MMTRNPLPALALLATATALLSACGGNGGSRTTTAPPTALKLEDNFGTQFGVDYRASPNSEPVHPSPGDVVPVSATTEPRPLH